MGIFEENREEIEALITKVIMQEQPVFDEENNQIKTQKHCIEYLSDIYNVSNNAPYKWYQRVAEDLTSPAQTNHNKGKALKNKIQTISDECLDIIYCQTSTPEEIARAIEIAKACDRRLETQAKLSKLRF